MQAFIERGIVMTDQEVRELEKRVRERKEFVMRVMKFVEKIVRHGIRTFYYQGSSNTREIWELHDLEGLYFKGDFEQTMMGGNDILISRGENVLFEVYYQTDPKKCQVKVFDESEEFWQNTIKKFMQNYRKTVALCKKNKKEKDLCSSRYAKQEGKYERLRKEAQRLGISHEPSDAR
jgi:hypothetical protein